MGTDRSPFGVLRGVPVLIVQRRARERTRGDARRGGALAASLLTLLLSTAARAQPLSASASDAPPPAELSAAITAALAPASSKVQSGTTTLEFWWVKAVERGNSGAEGWAGAAEGALVGAVRVSAPYPDVRGKRIKPGVYTLRFALQPMNGDHLGVSPHREFLLVIPSSADPAPSPVGYQGAVDLSKQTTGAAHPAVWSIDPPSADGEPLRVLTNDEGHQAVTFRVQNVTFGLILIGKIEA